MATFRTSAYTGTTGATITAAGEGATSSFVSGGSLTYQLAQRPAGTCGRFYGQGMLITDFVTAGNTLYWRGYLRIPGAPNSNRMICDFRNGSTTLASLGLDTDGKLRLRNQAGVSTGISVTILDPGVWYGIRYSFDRAGGQQVAYLYGPDGAQIEEISGGATAGPVTQNREGVLQGDNTFYIDLDDTAIADTNLNLTGTQTDPPPQGPTDPYRISSYEGIAGGPLQVEGGNGYYSAFDGSGFYVSPGFAGADQCGRYVGQFALRTKRTAPFNPIVYQKGWIRFGGWPDDQNRLVLELQTLDGVSQAAVGVDMEGHWRLRTEVGVSVATSVRRITPDQWYGFLWTVNRTTGVQEFRVYSYYGSLLETISGPCGQQPTYIHLEGCTQGRPTWRVDFDQTVLHRQPQTVTSPLTRVPSNLQFRSSSASNAPTLTPYYWDGVALRPVEIFESL